MQYLEKLLEEFSDTPKNIIYKADILRRGIKMNDDLKRAGAKSCQTGLSSKLEGSLGAEGLPPSQFHFKADDTTVDIKTSETSPYLIREDNESEYHLYCGETALGEVWFTPKPDYQDKMTSDGQPMAVLITQRGPYCLFVRSVDFCAYFKKGEACKYCLLSLAMEARVQQKVAQPIPDPRIIAEAVETASRDVQLEDLKISGGALYDVSKEADIHIKCLDAIFERIEPPEEVTVFSQALERGDQVRLKEAGAKNVCFDMEVWDEGLYPEIVPGKAKAVGRKEWLTRLEQAVEVFGPARVGSNFVAGFECAPRPGYLSREEALKSLVEGFEYQIERGIVPWFTVWTAHPALGGFSFDDPPPTEWYLRLGQELHQLLDKHALYPELGFSRMGMDPPTLGLYCYYCYSMQFTRDYPRLIDRK